MLPFLEIETTIWCLHELLMFVDIHKIVTKSSPHPQNLLQAHDKKFSFYHSCRIGKGIYRVIFVDVTSICYSISMFKLFFLSLILHENRWEVLATSVHLGPNLWVVKWLVGTNDRKPIDKFVIRNSLNALANKS